MESTAPAAKPPRSHWRVLLSILLVVFAATLAVEIAIIITMHSEPPISRSFQGKPPPDFPAAGSWLNTKQPLNLTALKGKVVFLQFSFIH